MLTFHGKLHTFELNSGEYKCHPCERVCERVCDRVTSDSNEQKTLCTGNSDFWCPLKPGSGAGCKLSSRTNVTYLFLPFRLNVKAVSVSQADAESLQMMVFLWQLLQMLSRAQAQKKKKKEGGGGNINNVIGKAGLD